MAYADTEYYQTTYAGAAIPEEKQAQALEMASNLVDGLTMFRIRAAGFSTLTAFQQEIVKNVCCQIAEDLSDGGYLDGGVPLSGSFRLGDLSIDKDTNQMKVNGIPIRGVALGMLRATGLVYAGVV